MKYALLFTTAILIFACTTPVEKLNPGSDKVQVLKNPSVADLEKLHKIGTASCEIGGNAHTHNANQESCENDLRNEAAEKNADFIVFTNTTDTGMTTAYVEAVFYKKN